MLTTINEAIRSLELLKKSEWATKGGDTPILVFDNIVTDAEADASESFDKGRGDMVHDTIYEYLSAIRDHGNLDFDGNPIAEDEEMDHGGALSQFQREEEEAE